MMRVGIGMAALLFLVGLVPARAQLQGGNTSPFATQDPLAKALQQDSVYVGKSLRDRINEADLRAIAADAPSDRPLKIVVVNSLPESGSQYGTRDRYTKALHDYLQMGNGTLIIVTKNGVAVATDALPSDQLQQIAQQYAPEIQNNPVEGIRRTVQALTGQPVGNNAPAGAAEPAREDNGGIGWLPVLAVGAGIGGVAWFGVRAAKKSQALTEARIPVKRLHGEVVNGITYADTYLDLLPDSADATAARNARQEAAQWLEQAGGFAKHARSPEDLGRAQALLEQAKEQTEEARKHIDLATGGTGFAVAIEGTDYKATPKTASEAAPVVSGLSAEDIPAQERGACFFCSRPARISDLTPITIALNGQRRKVLACADDVRIVREGATPEVRTVEDNGQRVPWYVSRRYDPYRDYSHAQAYYAPGYVPYAGYDAMDGLMLGLLLSQPMPMAYPVFVTPSGGYTDNPQMADMGQVDTDLAGVGGADFFGVGGSDFGNGNTDLSGSDSGNSDFGGSDWGSSDSSAGVDFGGSDFGDSGGGDFGGGGGDY